jgi:hypothetical protein
LSDFRIVDLRQNTLQAVQNYQLKATVQVKKAVVKPFYTSLGAAFEQDKQPIAEGIKLHGSKESMHNELNAH